MKKSLIISLLFPVLLIAAAAQAAGPFPGDAASQKETLSGICRRIDSFVVGRPKNVSQLPAVVDTVELATNIYLCSKDNKELLGYINKALARIIDSYDEKSMAQGRSKDELTIIQAHLLGIFMQAYQATDNKLYLDKGKSLASRVIDQMKDGPSREARARAGVGLLWAYRATGDDRYLNAATHEADAIKADDSDYATQAFSGLLLEQSYQASGDRKYLTAATRIAERLSPPDSTAVLSAWTMAVFCLTDLGRITGDDKYMKAAKGIASRMVFGKGEFTDGALLARYKVAGPTYELIVIGKSGDRRYLDLIKKAFMFDEPCRVVLALDPARDAKRIDELGYRYDGKPIMYVCSDKTCFKPLSSEDTLKGTKKDIEEGRKRDAGKGK